eukprot:Skav214231  [mRNA]  locus=scaffold1133:6956:10370:+ [translate_table: standard]
MWSSSIFHEPAPDDRHRDLFPLPRLEVDRIQKPGLCRTTLRRVLSRARVGRAIDSLNSLFFGSMSHPMPAAVSGLDGLPLIQREAISSIIDAVKMMGAPPNACDSGALKALRVAASAYFEPEVSVGDVVPLQLDRLSLPDGTGAGVDLKSALDPSLLSVVENFEDFMLQDPDVWTSISRDCSHLKPYSDPSLKDRKQYLIFLKMMYDRGILSFVDRCRGRVGAFTVSKKPKVVDGVVKQRQRLVLDCRQTNLLFRPSPHTELGSLASLAELDLDRNDTLYMGGSDIQDCFYGVHIPTEMMQYFCFEHDITGADACWVSGGAFVRDDMAMVSPCVNVLPMGFSWSFYLVQHIHQCAVLRSLDITTEELFLDARPPPVLVPDAVYSMPYCDNIHCLSLNQVRCEEGKQSIVDELSNMGFCVHEDVPATTHFETLGGVVDGEAGQVRMTNRRAWDLTWAFEHAADHVISPDIMRRLLGHAMFFSTLNRSGMSVFRRCYDFIESSDNARKLNNRERQECLIFAGLIPLLFADVKRPWSEVLTCSDASPDGYGICECRVGVDTARQLGRWNERWRFRRLGPEDWAPRRRALARDAVGDPVTVTGCEYDGWGTGEAGDDIAIDDGFPEVDASLSQSGRWSTVLMGKWRTSEHITLKEGRALILCLRRLTRSSLSRSKKHVVLVDNFGLALAVSKGRAKNFQLLRITQQAAALTLAGGFGVRLRDVAVLKAMKSPARNLNPSSSSKRSSAKAVKQVKQPQMSKATTVRTLRSAVPPMMKAPPPRRTVGRMTMEPMENLGKRAQSKMLTMLETRSVSKEVQHQYSQYLLKFENFCRVSGLGWPLRSNVDDILADFLDVLFLDGGTAAEGEKVVAAMEFSQIQLKGTLLRCKRALKGWRRERPPQSRLPLPRLIACGMAMILASQGKKLMALKLMVDHDTYLRPGESIELRGRDVVPPVRNTGQQYRWHSIIVRDCQDFKPDKVGVFDNSIPLNSKGREFLGPLLMSRVIKLNSKDDFIYPFTAAEYRKCFQVAGERLSIKNLHPYQTRHGGASEDLNSGERDPQSVKIRGRWHTDQSVRRYGKVGKIQRLMAGLSPSQMEFCQWSQANMEKMLRGHVAPRHP